MKKAQCCVASRCGKKVQKKENNIGYAIFIQLNKKVLSFLIVEKTYK